MKIKYFYYHALTLTLALQLQLSKSCTKIIHINKLVPKYIAKPNYFLLLNYFTYKQYKNKLFHLSVIG